VNYYVIPQGKAAKNRTDARHSTGGGPPTDEPLDEVQQNALDAIGVVSIEGIASGVDVTLQEMDGKLTKQTS
jgi:hypothetical protein